MIHIWQQDLMDAYGDNYDPEYIPIMHAGWQDYEECGWLYVLQKDNQYYVLKYAYSVMSDDNTAYWEPYAVNEDQLWEILLEWEEHL
jgi:hypothetical protein